MREEVGDQSPYKAPTSHVGALPSDGPKSLSFRLRCMIWALVAPILAILALNLVSLSPVSLTILLLAFLFVPTFWLLWSDFGSGGMRAVSISRFLAVTAIATGAAFFAFLMYGVLFVIAYSIWEYFAYGI